MADQVLGIKIKIDSETGKLTILNKELDNLKDSSAKASTQLSSLDGTMAAINIRMVGVVAAGYAAKNIFDMTVGSGIALNSQFEQMKLGIASLIAVNSSNVTAMGHSITTVQKFQMAQAQAAESVELLRKANIQTPATLAQITEGYQAALGPSLRLGLSTKQTVEYVKLMTMAAAAMGAPMNQIAQESRALLSGEIDMNAQVARNLQITNEQIKMHTQQGDLYEFLTKKLGDFAAGGEEMSKSWEGISSNIIDSIEGIQKKATEGIFENLKADGVDLQTKLTENADNIADTFARGFSNIYLAAAPAVEGIYLAFSIGFQSIDVLLNTFVGLFGGAIDDMNGKYRELGFFDYLTLGVVVAIEGIRQLGSAGLSVITFLGSMMNTFQGITLNAFAGIAGAMGKLTDMVGLDGSSFYASQAYWVAKSNAVKSDGLLIDQTQKEILGDMAKGADRLAHSYNQLALKKNVASRPVSQDSLLSKPKEADSPTAAELAKAKAKREKEEREDAADAKKEAEIQKGYLESYAEMEAKSAIAQYELDLWYIDDLASRQASSALAIFDMTRSEADKINDQYLSLYETSGSLFDETTMTSFFTKWQESIDGIKSKMDFSANIEFDPSMMDGLQKAVAGVGKSMGQLQKEDEQYNANKLLYAKGSKEYAKNEEDHTQSQIAGYSNLAGAASAMFEQGSKEAQAFTTIQAGLAMVNAVTGIAKQSELPFPYNIAAMAGTAATVFSFLSSAGISGHGSASSSSSASASIPNSGTVLGDSAKVSESTTAITDLLSSIHVSEYSQLRDINRAVTSMSQNISSAITNIFRAGTFDTSGVKLTTVENGITSSMAKVDSFFSKLSGGNIGFDPITSFANGLLASIGLGGSSKQYIAGSGFGISSGTLGSKQDASTLGAYKYLDVETASKNFWGSASYSHNITNTALDSASSQSIALIYKSFNDTMMSINKGLDANLSSAISGYQFNAISLNLNGLSSDDAIKKLNDTFSALGDTMANDVFGSILDQYQKLGEGMLETAVRVITEKEVLLQDLANVNKTITGDVISITQSLVDLSGGLTKFSDANSSYFDNYFTDAEKSATYQKNLSAVYSSMNLAMPSTVTGFRALVDSLDLNTLSGRETYTSLMNIADAQKTYIDSLKELSKISLANDMLLPKVSSVATNDSTAINNQLLVQVVKTLKSIRDNALYNISNPLGAF